VSRHRLLVEAKHGREPTIERSGRYQLFSRVFSYPTDELIELQRNRSNLGPRLPVGARGLEKLQTIYSSLFDTGKISLLEHSYRKEETAVLEDLVRYYEHFGLNVGQLREAHDHLTVELEFMHYLTFLEAGTAADAGALVRAEGDFLARHLSLWLPSLRERLAAVDAADFYFAWAKVVEEAVAEDMRDLQAKFASDK
jgi:DMSO reductase family type II enzyme chaperone